MIDKILIHEEDTPYDTRLIAKFCNTINAWGPCLNEKKDIKGSFGP
jgi:hypothetical protein